MSAVGSILTNTGALNAINSLTTTTSSMNNLENELSTGLAINSPADNPAGYMTAQGFTSQINGITQGVANANEGVSLLQTADGALTQQVGIVQQLNTIAVQAANGTQTSSESASLQSEVANLVGQSSTIAGQTQFNDINLLNGTFSGVQLQVGANEGQTISLSIGSTMSSAIGMYATTSSLSTGTASGSAAVSAAGAYTAGNVVITGATGGSGTVAVTATESAAAVAKAANSLSATTGVDAVATNTASYTLAAGTTNNLITFSLQASGSAGSVGKAVTVNATSLSQAVSQINQTSDTTGITASSASGTLSLTQGTGDNIKFAAVGTAAAGGTVTQVGGAAVAAADVQQGQVQFQASGAFAVAGGSAIGSTNTATLDSLASINVSTTAGANNAINVIKYALAAINNTGGQLGAVQDGLTANINNNDTTITNLNSALGTVQDANIPQVSTDLTQSEIQAQSGVAALASSTQLQQAFIKLLP